MSYSDLRKKYGLTTDEDEEDRRPRSEDYAALQKKHGLTYDQVDDSYINTFITDADTFIGSEQSEFEKVGWSNASSSYESRYKTWQELNARSANISIWLESNKSTLDKETYKKLSSAIVAFRTESASGMTRFKRAKDTMSQYESQEAYDAAVEKWQKYYDTWGKYAEAEDFEEKSKYKSTYRGGEKLNYLTGTYTDTGFDDITYDYINGDKTAKDRQLVNDVNTNASLLGIDNSELLEMEPEEVSLFNYIYATEGSDKAYEYIAYITSDLNARQRTTEEKYWAEYAKNDPVGSSVFSILVSPMKGLSYIGQSADYFSDGSIDQNAGYNKFSYSNSAIRNEVASKVERKWGKVGSFGYQVGMSMGDFLVSTAVSGGNQAFALAIMGTGAAADATMEAKDRGLTDDQAFALGTIAGTAEIVMEKIGLDALLDMTSLSKSAMGYLLKNILAEGGEELGTSTINLVADIFVSKDKSHWQMAVDSYRANGLDATEAFWRAVGDQAVSMGLDFLGGAISGGAMGGGAIAVNTGINAYKANQVYGSDPGALVAEALEINPDNSFAQKLQGRLDNGKNLSGRQLNRLVQQNESALKAQDESSIQKATEVRLADLGETGDVSALAKALTKQAAGENLSKAEQQIISGSKYGQRVANELNAKNIRSGEYSSTWAENIGTERINTNEYNKALMELAEEKVAAEEATDIAIGILKKQSAEKKLSPEGHYEVSKEHKMINTKTGEIIEPQGLVQTENGTYKIATKDGEPVSNSDVSYEDYDQALVYETFLNLEGIYGKSSRVIADMDLDSRNELLSIYNPKINTDGGTFISGITSAFFYGHRGIDMSTIDKDSPMMALTEQQRKFAWNVGRKAGMMANAKAQSNVDTVYEEAKTVLDQTGTKKGSYHAVLDDGITPLSLNKAQKAVYRYADDIAQGVQTTIHVYAGTDTAQGFYDHSTDEIWLNLNAANNSREAIMAFTLAHELVHRAKKGSPAKYQAFVDFLMKEYGKQGASVEAMIAEQMEAAKEFNKTVPADKKINMTEEKAFDEVVCDACQRMLLDTNAGQKLAEFGAQSKENKSFLDDLKRWITELLEKLRSYFKNAEPDSLAAQELAKFDANVKQILADMYVDMSIDAGEKLSTIKAAAKKSQAESVQEGKSFSLPKVKRPTYQKPAYQEWDVETALLDALDHADKGRDHLISVGNMPNFVVNLLGIDGDFYIYRNHSYENMVTEKQAVKDGRFDEEAHYHGLGIETMTDAIMALENPMITIATKTDKGNPAVIMLLPVEGKKETPLYAVLSFYSKKDINGDYSRRPHIVLSVYERNIFEEDGREGIADVIRNAVREKRVISFDKEMRDYLTVKTKEASLGIISEQSLTDNLSRFLKEIKSFREKNHIDYKLPVGEDTSPRALLANAFEGIITNDIEKRRLEEYKGKMEMLYAEEEKLRELRAQIKELSFAKGKRDTKRIKDLQFEANKTANRIAVLDGILLRLEAAAPLQNVLKREKEKAYERGKQRVRKSVDEYRESRNKTVMRQNIRKTVRELDKILNRGNKKQNVKEDMKGFVSKALELADYLFTDHISNDDLIRKGIDSDIITASGKAQLVKETEDILSLLYDNADSLTDDEFTRLDAKRKANEDKLRDLLAAQRNRRLEIPVYNLFNDLVTEYASLKNVKQEAVKAAYDPNVERFLRSYIGESNGETDSDRVTLLQNMRVADMTTDELWKLHNAYKMVLHSVRDANKLWVKGKTQTIDQMAGRIMRDFSKRKTPDGKVATVIRNLSNKIGWDYEKLYYALDRIGSEAFTELVMNIANSENIVMQDVIEAAAFRDEMVKKYGFNNWDVNKEIDREFLDNTGKKFKMTLGQLMSLYAYSRREGAWDHIEYGGFVFGEAALTNPKPADSYKLNKEQCEVITGLLTKEQKAYVEDMQKFLSETMGAKGNEVSMQLYGIELFGEKNYFPIHIAGQFKAQAQESQAKAAAGFSSMSNAGFTHAQNPNAKAPFVLEGFNEIWADHVNEMSRYHGTVPALEDMRRVMNRSSYYDAGVESMAIKQLMENSFGKEAVEYFDNLYREVNSGAITDKLQRIPKKLLSLFRKNSVAYKLSVLIQQPTSIIRAYAMIDKKYFGIKGFGTITSGVVKAVSDKWTKAHTNTYNEMLKYAPGVTLAKEIGGFDTHTGGSIRSYLLDTNKSTKQKWKTGTVAEKGKTALNLVDDNAIANLPNLADKIAWIEIWNAVKRETISKHHDLSPRSDEFMQIVGDRFTEVIRATQVYDSIFAKSPMLKSKSLGVQYLVSFMNEPNTTANMAESALRDAIRGNWKSGVKKAVVIVYGTIVVSLAKSIIYAMQDDDEDETYIEKYFESLIESLVNDFNPLSYFPVTRDISSALQGYDIERPDVAVIVDAIEVLKAMYNNANKDTENMTMEQIAELDKKKDELAWRVAESVAAFFGIPVKNIRKDVMGIYNTVFKKKVEMDTTKLSLTHTIEQALNDSQYFFLRDESKSKQDKLYDAIMSGDTAYVNRLKGSYKDKDGKFSQTKYDMAFRTALRENDLRIKEAALAEFNGNSVERMRITKEIEAERYFAQYEKNQVQRWVRGAINAEIIELEKKAKGNATEESTPKEYDDYTVEQYYRAVSTGKKADADTIYKYLVEDKEAEGYLRHEAEDAIATGFATQVGKDYMAGEISRSKAVQLLKDNTDKGETEVKKWDFELEHGFSWSERVRKYRLGKLSERDLVSAVMDIEGATRAEANEYIDFLDLEMANEDLDITANDAAGYFKYAESSGIPVEVYIDFKKQANKVKNDVDADGKTIRYSAVRKIMVMIDSLNLTSYQKDALAQSMGWAESTIKEYKTW